MKEILRRQIWHFSILALLLAGMIYYYKSEALMKKGGFLGVSTKVWFIISVCVPIAHQVYVLVLWRLELFKKSLSKAFGKKGFVYFKIGFSFLILLRPITIIILAFSNSNTIEINAFTRYLVTILLLFPGIYLAYSIKRFFGIDRAFGIDHFYPEKAKSWPMVKQGIFKYSSNSMYVFGFMALWVPGLLLQSKAALILALFSHSYIWVHYFFTEKPDMDTIYN
jgi:hypothetical protein